MPLLVGPGAGRPSVGFGHYSASKSALEAVTEVLRTEVAPLRIRVMAVEPGAFRTRAYTGFAREAVEETIPAYLPPSRRSAPP
ncbi:SDR family NAD(P)-dependent oxidoreductase [Micromonospora harpali]|uniref:SDR family NAD(P)-dependent oxidoreductase n=1 Tax=Micromonospora harpali TaxID=1490225 RepID=A0ABW1HIY1_9ACTN